MQKMKISLIFIIVSLPFFLIGQCSIIAIEWGEGTYCNEATDKMVIPVNVVYQGMPDTIRVSVSGLAYDFPNRHFMNNGVGEVTFVVYQAANGQPQNYVAFVDLMGGNCPTVISDSEPYSFTAPNGCIENPCLENLVIDGIIATTEEYKASNSIISTQVFEQGADVHVGATNAVTLLPGFQAKAGSQVLINNIGCSEN